MKKSMLSILAFYVLMYPNLVIFSFLGFKKNFEHFLVILLKDFESDLERFLEKSCFDKRLHGCLIIKYQRIIELNNKFNKYVGPQMTMAVCCLTGILICQVRAIVDKFFREKILSFQKVLSRYSEHKKVPKHFPCPWIFEHHGSNRRIYGTFSHDLWREIC